VTRVGSEGHAQASDGRSRGCDRLHHSVSQSGFDSRLTVLLSGAFSVAALALCLWTVGAYEFGLTVALGAVVAVAVALVVLNAPLAGVCLAVLAAPVDYLAAGGGGSVSVTPSEAILFITALSVTPRLLTTVSAQRIPTALYAFAGLIFVSIAGLFFAIDTFTVMRIVIDWLAFGLISLFVSQRGASDLTAIAISLALSGGILGVMALGNLSEQQAIAGGAIVTNRASASFAHPTSLALFLILTFPAAFALGLRGPTRWRWVMMASGVLALLGLLLTETRGSIIGAGFALIWMMARWAPFRRLALAGLGVLVIVVALSFGSVTKSGPVTVVGDRLATLSLNSEGDQRLEIWATTPKIIAEHPIFGIGQGNFPAVSPAFGLVDVGGVPFDHAHDLFLNIAAELGLVGLALLLIMLFALVGSARTVLADRQSEFYPLGLAITASLLGVLVNSLTEYPLRQNLILATILIDIGLLLGIERITRARSAASTVARQIR